MLAAVRPVIRTVRPVIHYHVTNIGGYGYGPGYGYYPWVRPSGWDWVWFGGMTLLVVAFIAYVALRIIQADRRWPDW
jgi:hypothetical protein